METKKILMLIPSFGFGGAQRVFSDHAKMLSEEYLVEECVFNNDWTNTFPTPNTVHSLNVPAGKSFLEKIYCFYQRVNKLKKLKKKHNFDVCISHLEGADYVNILSRQSEKIILVIHGSKVADENISGVIGWIRKKVLLPWLYKKANIIITVSDGIKEELEKTYHLNPSKIFSIPNYFDISHIIRLSEAKIDESILKLGKKNQLLLYSGRFAKQKNLIPLFTIFKNAQHINPKIKLLIIGDGELKLDLYKECDNQVLSYFNEEKSFNENYDVYFLGFQSNPFAIIRACNLFIMTSKWEGFPMALCEAMAVGACVIASDCPTGPKQILWGSNNEFINNNTGVLLPIPSINNPDTILLWTNKIIELLSNNSLMDNYKNNAHKRALDFSREKITIKWKSIIAQP